MIFSMDNWATQATEKLTKEQNSVAGQKEKVMAPAVFAALKDFCLQNEAFAQAVIKGGSFADCLKAVAKNVGNAISDVDAYKKAVQFYFPGADVKMQLTIDLPGTNATGTTDKKSSPMILDLGNFF